MVKVRKMVKMSLNEEQNIHQNNSSRKLSILRKNTYEQLGASTGGLRGGGNNNDDDVVCLVHSW